MMSQDKRSSNSKPTTGHVWDDDLEELTNPLPMWWVWGFYITCAFALVYWLLYPAWPVAGTYTKGLPGVNTITYTATTVDGKEVQKTTHWNMRAKFMAEMNEHTASQKQWFDQVASMTYEDVAKNADLMQFVNSAGKTLFTTNCMPCHQAGAQGKIGIAPNLIDDYWQYGGAYEQINTTLTYGRHGVMPAFKQVLNEQELGQVVNYVLSLSGEPHNEDAAKAGDALFHGPKAGCYVCHGENAKGKVELGSANLTDKIWLWADVTSAQTEKEKVDLLVHLISNGVNKGVMPAWGGRLKPEQIKLLTVYVHDSLGGGK
jgi:cytochrome c oxidase cbb3-type subunit 3